MDPHQFDGMILKLSGALSRRSLVGGSLAAALLGVVGLDDDGLAKKRGRGDGRLQVEACISTGKKCPAKKPRGKKGKQLSCNDCCQRRTTTNANGKTICYCAQTGTACTQTRECCDGTCTGGVCRSGAGPGAAAAPAGPVGPAGPAGPVEPPGCPGLGMTCSTPPGTPCCPDSDPAIVCAGGSTRNRTCQNCNQPATVEGALCQEPRGNQCCGGSPTCFSGVRVLDGTAICLASGTCRVGFTCTQDFTTGGCPGGQTCCPVEQPVCIRADAACCLTGETTFCGAPCATG